MPQPLAKPFTLHDLQQAHQQKRRLPMLTCYDYSTARLMQQAGIPLLLVGDSAANVILGHNSTVPVSLEFMIEIAAAVKRGAPLAYVIADMPFGSYHGSTGSAVQNVARMVKLSNCDAVKLEVSAGHARLISRLHDAGIAVVAHIGLRPQAVSLTGGYRYQGRTAAEAKQMVALARTLERAGASALLIEAVPDAVGAAIAGNVGIPTIGCGAGSAGVASVVVTPDMLGITPTAPRFVPRIAKMDETLIAAFDSYARQVTDGTYPSAEHAYPMPAAEQELLRQETHPDKN